MTAGKLTEAVRGKFCRMRKSTRIVARPEEGGTYFVERWHWKVPKVAIMNQISGVPRNAIKF